MYKSQVYKSHVVEQPKPKVSSPKIEVKPKPEPEVNAVLAILQEKK